MGNLPKANRPCGRRTRDRRHDAFVESVMKRAVQGLDPGGIITRWDAGDRNLGRCDSAEHVERGAAVERDHVHS